MPLDLTAAYNQSYNSSPAVNDLGLGDILKEDLDKEDQKRKDLMDKNKTSLTSDGIMSPATMALFNKGY